MSASGVIKCPTCSQSKGRGRPAINTRFDRQIFAGIKQLARQTGKTPAEIVRDAVTAALPELGRNHAETAIPILQPTSAPQRSNPKVAMNDLRAAGDKLTVPLNGETKTAGSFGLSD